MRYDLHTALNGWRWEHRHAKRPFGTEVERSNGITVRCLVPDHPYVVSSSCRVEREKWHNRIHHAEARYVATQRGTVLEYGFAACGSSLIDPLYMDFPIRLCDCGNGDASICPRCEMVAHPSGLAVCHDRNLFRSLPVRPDRGTINLSGEGRS